jgi:drug/metabolite transporter (DMT)-like permease
MFARNNFTAKTSLAVSLTKFCQSTSDEGYTMGKCQLKNVWLFVHAMLIALTPVILLPVSFFVYKEKVGWQAILGTVLAITGVAILFLA